MATGYDINFVPSGTRAGGKTWADYPNGLAPPDYPGTGIGWVAESDLAQELYTMAGHDHLRYQEWRLLLSATQNGLPVVVTWDTRMTGMTFGDTVKIERLTRTMIVQRMSAPSLTRPTELPVRVRVSYSGFGHEIRAKEIREVAPPPTPPGEYLDVDQAATYVRANP